jgi:Na+-transporting methylmalonyl-CoA/oxaloacetate decarboxylase gamma subunit
MIIGLILVFSVLTILFYFAIIIERIKNIEVEKEGGELKKSVLDEVDNGEIIAVISAAISAYTKRM